MTTHAIQGVHWQRGLKGKTGDLMGESVQCLYFCDCVTEQLSVGFSCGRESAKKKKQDPDQDNGGKGHHAVLWQVSIIC